MLAVIFMRTAADIADLISLSRTSESCKESFVSTTFSEMQKTGQKFQE